MQQHLHTLGTIQSNEVATKNMLQHLMFIKSKSKLEARIFLLDTLTKLEKILASLSTFCW